MSWTSEGDAHTPPLNQSAAPRQVPEKPRRWRFFAPAGGVLVMGVMLSIAVFVAIQTLEHAKTKADFEQEARLVTATLERAVETSLDDAYSVADFFAAGRGIDEGQFRAFAKPMLARHPAVQALVWVQRVPEGARSAYEADVRATRLPGFEIFERDAQGRHVSAGRRPEYFVVHFRESRVEATGARVLGFDQNSAGIGRDAMARARDTGALAATGRFVTLPSAGKDFGFFACVPVYRRDLALDTVEARRAGLLGFGQVVFGIRELIERSLGGLNPQGLRLMVFDQTTAATERALYARTLGATSDSGIAQENEALVRAGLHFTASVDVGGRRWEFLLSPTPVYLSAHTTHQAKAALVAGLLATALVVAYLLSSARARRSERLVALRTAELRSSEARYRNLFERNIAGVLWTDRSGKVIDCNESLARTLGYDSRANVLEHNVIDFYVDPEDRRAVLAGLEPGGTAMGRELHWRRRDGTPVWLRTNIRMSDDGHTEGILIDITNEKRVAEAEREATELRAIATLAAAAAHEINNPLGVIIGQASVLQTEVPTNPRIPKILGAADRVREIVERMPRITRVEMFQHPSVKLPPMIDIKKSSEEGS